MPDRPRCPHCESFDTCRSRRRMLERLLLGFKPFRCRDCNSRFYAYQPAETARQTQSGG